MIRAEIAYNLSKEKQLELNKPDKHLIKKIEESIDDAIKNGKMNAEVLSIPENQIKVLTDLCTKLGYLCAQISMSAQHAYPKIYTLRIDWQYTQNSNL